MAKLNVIQNIQGTVSIVSTWEDNLAGAKQAYFHQVELLYSDAPTTSGVCGLYDEHMQIVDGCREEIKK